MPDDENDRDSASGAEADFGVEENDADELGEPSRRGNGGASPDEYDMQAIIEGFARLPIEERTKRLLHLVLTLQTDNGNTRVDLADHKMQDRQEFLIINEALTFQKQCLELLFAHFGLQLPPGPIDRPHRKEE